MQEPQFAVTDHQFKMIMSGSSAAGKSTILKAMKQSGFEGSYTQTRDIVQDNLLVEVKLAGHLYSIKLNTWDIPGAVLSLPIAQTYFRNAAVVLIVYDCTQLSSLTSSIQYFQKIQPLTVNSLLYLVGTKNDQTSSEQPQTQTNAEQFSTQFNMKHVQINATNESQVQNMINSIAKDALRNKLGWSEEFDELSMNSYSPQLRCAVKVRESGVLNSQVVEPDVTHNLEKKEKKGCCK
ncbi:Rab11 [Hexamita inflata]|uniref:Rab11 n=1 Tax=Hexamita inflata TaxID=28002 RepID=A0AA86RH86_9EUKA|nr:Rab11 [Hexamita inflata]